MACRVKCIAWRSDAAFPSDRGYFGHEDKVLFGSGIQLAAADADHSVKYEHRALLKLLPARRVCNICNSSLSGVIPVP